MRAVHIDSGRLSVTDRPQPDAADECLIRVLAAGICGTDLHIRRGYAGFRGTPGHEFVGRVEQAPHAARDWIGRRVVGEINVGCGVCAWCRRGEKEHCPGRTVLGIVSRSGAFAELTALPAANLHAVPDSLADEHAVFVEPVAAACRILEQVPIAPDSNVGVLGTGRFGLLIAQVLATRAARVAAIGRNPSTLQVARDLGLEAVEVSESHAHAEAFDIVVDATGRPEGLEAAVRLTRSRGTLVMKSTFSDPVPFTTWPLIVREITLVGSRCGPFEPAIALLASGRVRVEPLIAGVYGLDEAVEAFDRAERALKVLFRGSR